MRLIRRDGTLPPGGFPYQDPKTGMKFDGFDAGGFGDQILRILKHRQANPKIYPPGTPDLEGDHVANQLDEYQCLRLGNDPRFCVNEGQPHITPTAQVLAFKCSCGGDIIERLCSTCSGRKVIGRRCSVCGKEYR